MLTGRRVAAGLSILVLLAPIGAHAEIEEVRVLTKGYL